MALNDCCEISKYVFKKNKQTINSNIIYPFLESKISANERQGNWYAEPESEQSDEGSERNSRTAAHPPEDQVKDKEDTEYDADWKKLKYIINIIL